MPGIQKQAEQYGFLRDAGFMKAATEDSSDSYDEYLPDNHVQKALQWLEEKADPGYLDQKRDQVTDHIVQHHRQNPQATPEDSAYDAAWEHNIPEKGGAFGGRKSSDSSTIQPANSQGSGVQCKSCGSSKVKPGSQGSKYTCQGCGTGIDENGYPDMVGRMNHGRTSSEIGDPEPIMGLVQHPQTGEYRKKYDSGHTLRVRKDDTDASPTAHIWNLYDPQGNEYDSGMSGDLKSAEQDADASHYQYNYNNTGGGAHRAEAADKLMRTTRSLRSSTGSISDVLAAAGTESRILKVASGCWNCGSDNMTLAGEHGYMCGDCGEPQDEDAESPEVYDPEPIAYPDDLYDRANQEGRYAPRTSPPRPPAKKMPPRKRNAQFLQDEFTHEGPKVGGQRRMARLASADKIPDSSLFL